MKVEDAIHGVTRIFLDTAPVIYYVENVAGFVQKVRPIFDLIDSGDITAVASPVTLSECLIMPLRSGLLSVQQTYMRILLSGDTVFGNIVDTCALRAADLRANYNLGLLDAMQFAVAENEGCEALLTEALLTNDKMLSKVPGMRVIVVDDLDA